MKNESLTTPHLTSSCLPTTSLPPSFLVTTTHSIPLHSIPSRPVQQRVGEGSGTLGSFTLIEDNLHTSVIYQAGARIEIANTVYLETLVTSRTASYTEEIGRSLESPDHLDV